MSRTTLIDVRTDHRPRARVCLFALTLVALLLAAAPTWSQTTEKAGTEAKVHTLTETLDGAVGGVAVDRGGNIYVADFGDTVWRVKPHGEAEIFATGFYGASGNAIEATGQLLQSSFYGNYVSRVNRNGGHQIIARGFRGPVGIAAAPDGSFFVCNCQGNSISKVTAAGAVSTFVESDLLNCPNGITRDSDGTLYVVNFSDEQMLRITPEGEISRFATLPGGGNGHVTVARGELYATSFQGHRLYRVSKTGTVTLIAGTGAMGAKDGPGSQALFSWPNGIAAGALGDRVFINDYLNRRPPGVEIPQAPQWTLRQVKLPSLADAVSAALRSGGVQAMAAAYDAWKADPTTASVYTELEINQLAYQLLGSGQAEAAGVLFERNTVSYPQSWNAWDSLAESHMRAGRNEEAIRFYEKSLELNPGNANGEKMLRKIRGEGDGG